MLKFNFKLVPLVLDMTSLKGTEVILLQLSSFPLLFIMYLPNHSTTVPLVCRHLGILFPSLVENIQVRQMSSHFKVELVEFLFRETMNRVGSETQDCLTSLAHATYDYSCRAIWLRQHGPVYQLSSQKYLVFSSKNTETHR